VDIITGTLGKALGGASGGFTSARKEVVAMLRQRSRPYLFSNTLAPVIAGASIAVLDLLQASTALRDTLEDNTRFFRSALTDAGFALAPGAHPIIPVMLGDAVLAQRMAARLLELGVYVVGFFFPVVPRGKARIRVQISAVHSRAELEFAVRDFAQAGLELGILHAGASA
jgi:glycine C-acetyltransferase